MKKLSLLIILFFLLNIFLMAQPSISLYPAQRYKMPYQYGIMSERQKWNTLSIRSIDAPFILLGEQRTKYVFTDPNFNLLDETIYNYVGENVNNRIPIGMVSNSQLLFGFVSPTGSIVISPLYYDIYPFVEGRAEVLRGGRVGIINEEGKKITPVKYERIGDFFNGVAVAEFLGKFLLLSETGEELTPAVYNYIGRFEDNLAPVKKNNLWGFIDRMGIEVIPVEYTFVSSFELKRAIVGINNKFGLITNEGVLLTSIEYDEIGTFVGDWTLVKKDGKKLSLSRDGKEYLDLKNK